MINNDGNYTVNENCINSNQIKFSTVSRSTLLTDTPDITYPSKDFIRLNRLSQCGYTIFLERRVRPPICRLLFSSMYQRHKSSRLAKEKASVPSSRFSDTNLRAMAGESCRKVTAEKSSSWKGRPGEVVRCWFSTGFAMANTCYRGYLEFNQASSSRRSDYEYDAAGQSGLADVHGTLVLVAR